MAGRQEVGDRSSECPGIPTSRFWPSDNGKSDGRVSQLQESGQSASGSFQRFGHNFHNLDYFRQQEDFFATLDAGEEVNPQAKGAKGGYPWGSAGLSMAAKAMGSVWRSVAVPKAEAPAPASFAMDPCTAIRVNSASVAKSAAASASAVGTRGTAFHAVWCHERCHKHDAAMLRAQLQLIMSRFEGELICQKTAGKFKLWLVSDKAEALSELDEKRPPKAGHSQGHAAAQGRQGPAVPAESQAERRYMASDEDHNTGDDLLTAVAAANDEKLLLKYAQRKPSEGSRPGRGRVFAPMEIDLLSGEPAASDTWQRPEDAKGGIGGALGSLQLSHLAQGPRAERRRAWTSETDGN